MKIQSSTRSAAVLRVCTPVIARSKRGDPRSAIEVGSNLITQAGATGAGMIFHSHQSMLGGRSSDYSRWISLLYAAARVR